MSRFEAALIATVATALSVILVGCTTTANGNPAPGTQTNGGGESSESVPPSSGEPDQNGAPRVTDPLDADQFIADPCAALTVEQLSRFGITSPGEPDTEGAIATEAGPSCVWQTAQEVPSTLGVGYLTGNENGLADMYGARDRYVYFEETTVSGYPAVFRDTLDRRDIGTCTIAVGVSDSLYFRVSEQGDLDAVGACERAEQVAAAVIETMQGG